MLDRVSRVTQGDLVMSMDQLLTKPRLGSCHKFCIQPFTLANSKTQETLFSVELFVVSQFDLGVWLLFALWNATCQLAVFYQSSITKLPLCRFCN